MAPLSPPPPRPAASLRLWVAAAVLVLVACVGGVLRVRNATLAQTPSTAPPGRPAPGVGALGRLEPGWKVFHIAPASTADGVRVESLLVEEGDLVQPGATLAVLDTHARRQAAHLEANAQAVVARAKLAQVKAGSKSDDIAAQEALTARHRASLEHASAGLHRARRLISTRAISDEEFDQRQMDFATQQASLHQAEKTLAAIKAVRPEDVAVAEAEVVRAEAGVARAEADLEASKVVSPIAGRVLKLNTRPGERVGEGGIAEVGDTAAMHAVAEVYERDAPRVKVGQRARAKIQSLPGELSGEVVHVGWRVGRRVVLDNDPVKDTDARVVEVRVRLDSQSSARVAGLSYARVEIHVEAPPLTGGD